MKGLFLLLTLALALWGGLIGAPQAQYLQVVRDAVSTGSGSVSFDVATVSASVTTSYTVITTGNARLSLTNSSTLVFSGNPASGYTRNFTLVIVQGGAGSNVVTWPASVIWSGAASPTLSTSTTAVDVLQFQSVDQGTTWQGFLSGVDMR